MRLLPFASRTRAGDAFVQRFQRITALALGAHEQLTVAFQGATEQALARIVEIEHSADDTVREVHRLVDQTFIAPYDKRDIIKLTHQLDRVVDGMRTVVRSLVSYRALEAKDSPGMTAIAREMSGLVLRCVTELKHVVDEMPSFDHDGLREAARLIDAVEQECDDRFAHAVRTIFPKPDQPLTAATLAWRDIFHLLERITDDCSHAMGVILSIARQEGS